MARPRKTVDIFVDTRYSVEQRRAIAEEAIRYIKDRTAKGNGVNNAPFRQNSQFQGGRRNSRTYADSYRDTREFEIAGKSPAPINLRLTGDMLDSLEIIDVSLTGKVTIGFKEEGEQSDKAWFNEEKGYRFLDLSDNEVNKISRDAAGSVRSAAASVSLGIAERIARRLFGDSE